MAFRFSRFLTPSVEIFKSYLVNDEVIEPQPSHIVFGTLHLLMSSTRLDGLVEESNSNSSTSATKWNPHIEQPTNASPDNTSTGAMEGETSAGTDNYAAKGPSTPHRKQENLGSKLSTPRSLTAMELFERDRNAIAYTKSRLQEGDTLVFIRYPSNSEVFDHTGFRLTNETPLQVHSHKLLATGSRKFKELLSEWSQTKIKRRKGFHRGLPPGINYILDLTPPDEGDEAVELTTELSCSPAIRNWYTAEYRCRVPSRVCGGKDEVARPAKSYPATKNFIDLMDVLTDDLEPNIINEIGNYYYNFDEGIGSEIGPNYTAQPATGNWKQQEKKDLQEALERSKLDCQMAPIQETLKGAENVPEYCPVRHRAGIERLLQIIEGKEPRLDSAPKVWTLYVLAKYFDCTNTVADFIVSWVLTEPNCQFIELLPEATLKMGMGLKSAVLTRPAFAILVSEHALSIVSRECGRFKADDARTNQFGRAREDVDEDSLSAVQAAAYSLIGRVEKVLRELCDEQIPLFSTLPEYRKIHRIVDWVNNSNAGDEHEKSLLLDYAAQLQSNLAHFIRGRLILSLNQDLRFEENIEANRHRRTEIYWSEYQSNFENLYNQMVEKERILTRFPWKALGLLPMEPRCISNILIDINRVSNLIAEKNRDAAKQHGIKKVEMFDLSICQSLLNEGILKSIQNDGFNSGRIPLSCFEEPDLDLSDEEFPTLIEDNTGWRFPFTSPKNPSTVPPASPIKRSPFKDTQESFQVGMPDQVPNDLKYAPCSSSGRGFQAYQESRKDNDKLMGPVPTVTFSSCIRGLSKFPFRHKDPEDAEKNIDPNDINTERRGELTVGDAPDITSADLLATQHRLSGLQAGAPQSQLVAPRAIGPDLKFLGSIPKPHVPEDGFIEENSPFFSLATFLIQVKSKIKTVVNSMLSNGDELDFTVLTDTLLCLTDDEWKYLPLWAGGNEDGSGGVFAPMIPPAPAGAGPSGPGPAFHTGYSMASRSSTEMDFDGASTIGGSVDTSVAVDNGFSDHLDRRRVMTDDEFQSETFSDDSEVYSRKGKRATKAYYNAELDASVVSGDSEVYVDEGELINDDTLNSADHAPRSVTRIAEVDEDDDDIWDVSDEEEAFDFGDEIAGEQDVVMTS